MTGPRDADTGANLADGPSTGGLGPVGHRTAVALAWNFGASPLLVVVSFVRAILLLRLLPVSVFGTFAYATSIVFVSSLVAGFGMGHALLNRVPETQDERRASEVFFTLKTVATAVWVAVLVTAAALWTTGDLRTLLIGLTFTQAGTLFVDTPRLVLTRRVVHRRLVAVDMAAVVAGSTVSVLLAWRGQTVWALLGSEIAVLAVTAGMLVGWRPVWRPRFRWEPDIVRYYLRFAAASLPTSLLLRGIENADNLWTGHFLGDYSLGIYSRAYRFATYPRTLVALPTSKVVRGTFSELKGDPDRLARAFVTVNGTLVRTGSLLAGLLVLTAPEFVLVVGGEKWLPMVLPFQLLVVFSLLDPIRMTLSDLLLGIGEQRDVLRTTFLQLVALLVGLAVLGPRLGVPGVALAVNAMTVFATVALLHQSRRYVQFSARALWLAPALALGAGTIAAVVAMHLPAEDASPWVTALVKVTACAGAYLLVLGALERHHVRGVVARARRMLAR